MALLPGESYPQRVIRDGAAHYWRLGESAGTTAIDAIGGSANGTISGGVTLAQPGALADGDTAMVFNGTTGKIATAATVALPLVCTVECWVNNAGSGYQPILDVGAGAPLFYLNTTNQMSIYDAANGGVNIGASSSLTNGVWYHLVYVLDGSTLLVYHNGTAEAAVPVVRTVAGLGVATLGQNTPFNIFWQGVIDEVAIYPRVLSAAEIADHYALRTFVPAVPAGGLDGSDKAYLQARSGIARSAAIRSNYVWPLVGVISVGGVDITSYVLYGSLRVTQALNEQPDTASFSVMLTDSTVADGIYVGADVLIGLGGASENALFGGRVLTMQDEAGPNRTPRVRSVMCADYLQVLDSEYLVTYGWPPQSATTTIVDVINRFANKPGGVPISTAGVAPGLPSHASMAFLNERFSTMLRRLVTMFADGGGFYIDPLKVLHVWQGASEPGLTNPQPMTIDLASLKAFSETVDGSQLRDACLVEGMRTNAPLGTPGPKASDPTGRNIDSIPVLDASIFDPITAPGDREVRIGTQRLKFAWADGIWASPVGTPQTTLVTVDVAFNPDPAVEGNTVTIWIHSADLLTGRSQPWIRIDEQYLFVISYVSMPPTPYVLVPRTGYGAMIGAIQADAVVTVIDSISSLAVTDRYNASGSPERVRPQPIDSEVVMVARSATGDAIHEQLVQDGRFSRTGATNRGLREILDFREALISIAFDTDDLNAKPGRLAVYNLADPHVVDLVGEYMILTTEITWPVWGQPPRRHCQAAAVHAANVIDTWITDTR